VSLDRSLLRVLIAISLLCEVSGAQEVEERSPDIQSDGVPPGCMVIEGDILVPEGFFLAEGAWATAFWPGGIVPFAFDANVTVGNQALMMAAFAEWESVANVQFVPRTNEPDFIRIRDDDENNSFIGMIGGPQVINITDWDWHYILMHELGHALGYWHEQNRVDRDDFIQVNFANVSQTDCGGGSCNNNFQIQAASESYGHYDFDSFMHYGQFAFSGNGLPTIDVLPPWDEQWQTAIGQRDHMSFWDGTVMSFLYSFPDWRFVDTTATGPQVGDFFQPFQSVANGLNDVPAGGTLIVLEPVSFNGDGVYAKPLTIRAPLGGFVMK